MPWGLFLEKKVADPQLRQQRIEKIREWQRLNLKDMPASKVELNALVEKACDEVVGLYSRKVEEIRKYRRGELERVKAVSTGRQRKDGQAAATLKSKGEEKPKEKKQTIRAALYALFEKKGVDKVTVEEATKVALAVKPDSKFNKWHLYFHRKNYRREILDAEE